VLQVHREREGPQQFELGSNWCSQLTARGGGESMASPNSDTEASVGVIGCLRSLAAKRRETGGPDGCAPLHSWEWSAWERSKPPPVCCNLACCVESELNLQDSVFMREPWGGRNTLTAPLHERDGVLSSTARGGAPAVVVEHSG